ncbi:uncharacterized protein LOC134282059 [Saccostrea cucullata]|uniref:uncharacterized protein LOC134282059 n=1 Tax=Saccostrea cuccullata TaxID=36930 RepID=UPI002ED62235
MEGVITYIKSGKYPPSTPENEKRRIRKLAKSFIIEDGKLYRYKKSKLGDISKTLFIKDEKEKFKILEEYHDNNEHRGVVAVLKLVGSRYYWPEWTVFVRNYRVYRASSARRGGSLYKDVVVHKQWQV